MEQIAAARGIGLSTVEGHLARFVSSGEIRLPEIVPAAKIETIRKAVIEFSADGAIGPVKVALGDEYTYGEIRAVIASMPTDIRSTGFSAS